MLTAKFFFFSLSPERMQLLLWILRLPTNCHQICASKDLLPHFIDKLEKSTKDVMANIKEARRPILAEIYKVAKKEEALRNEEICKAPSPCCICLSKLDLFFFFSSPSNERRGERL